MNFNAWKPLPIVSLAVYFLASIPAFSQSKSTQPVLVVNSSGQPVPTAPQGITNVAGVVGLASGSTVNIGNMPNVNVSNTPSVNVANTPTVSLAPGMGVNVMNPLDTQNSSIPLATLEAAQPYEDSCQIQFNAIDGGCLFQTLPSGKRLIIQEFDAFLQLPSGSKPTLISLATSFVVGHYFPATFMGTGGGYDYFAIHQGTRLYAGPNSTPNCSVGVGSSSNINVFYQCRLSGFLVDVP